MRSPKVAPLVLSTDEHRVGAIDMRASYCFYTSGKERSSDSDKFTLSPATRSILSAPMSTTFEPSPAICQYRPGWIEPFRPPLLRPRQPARGFCHRDRRRACRPEPLPPEPPEASVPEL